jgi:hypothetical protein
LLVGFAPREDLCGAWRRGCKRGKHIRNRGASKETATTQETNMSRKIAFTALCLAIVFGSASMAAAAAKKHTDAGQAYGSAADKSPTDPRDAYWAKRKGGGDQTWCDADASCNGWGAWLEAVSTGKMKY